jgi:hypothetical protein
MKPFRCGHLKTAYNVWIHTQRRYTRRGHYDEKAKRCLTCKIRKNKYGLEKAHALNPNFVRRGSLRRCPHCKEVLYKTRDPGIAERRISKRQATAPKAL